MLNIATALIATTGLGLAAVVAPSNAAAADKAAARTMMSAPDAPALPAGHRETNRRTVSVDGERAILTRYERTDGRNAAIGGEHYSTVVDANGRLKGFARMSLDLVDGPLPSKQESEEIAMQFLRAHAPDLLPSMRISWIDRHDEPLRVVRDGRAEDLTLTGMKVKMRNTADGRWFWAIVGADREVMVFERDIVWINFPGHRQTEKWLHDAWLVEEGFAASAS